MSASAGSSTARNVPSLATRCGPRMARSAIRRGSAANARQLRRTSPRRSRRLLSRTPKTVRMITSSVIACMVGQARQRLAGRPALDLARRHLGHRLLVAAHALAVERRQHELALRHVGVVVEEQHRVAAEHRQQHDVRLAGVQEPRVPGEHLLHGVRVAQEHPDALVRDPQGEHVAVAPRGVLHERRGPRDPASGLERARGLRSGWQRGLHLRRGYARRASRARPPRRRTRRSPPRRAAGARRRAPAPGPQPPPR